MSVGLRAALYLISPKKASRTRTKQNTEMEVRTKLRRVRRAKKSWAATAATNGRAVQIPLEKLFSDIPTTLQEHEMARLRGREAGRPQQARAQARVGIIK